MPNTRENLEVIAHLGDHITYKEGIGICYDSALAEVIEDAYMTLKNGVTVQEWISVRDRLPDACGNVLTYSTEYGDIDLYYYMGHGEFDHHRNGITDAQTHGFTHWMPLPQPPKGE